MDHVGGRGDGGLVYIGNNLITSDPPSHLLRKPVLVCYDDNSHHGRTTKMVGSGYVTGNLYRHDSGESYAGERQAPED